MLNGRRYDSKWKRITVVGTDGNSEKVFELDNLGRLISKFPKLSKRHIHSSSCPQLKTNKISQQSDHTSNKNNEKSPVVKFVDAILSLNKQEAIKINPSEANNVCRSDNASTFDNCNIENQDNLTYEFADQFDICDIIDDLEFPITNTEDEADMFNFCF
ncbi:hypothetical protein TRFO_04505 [Tritrichomonas foetus]|uniref:Uncharacterized protein n=1 Tax=Tritrichomonas foetus TaxID=1144522 RepID=A0A1J4KEK9_9EUKA|nr:hypothetical protein TRFO_04505 [Tritrichomonas foetus]|eukprot:OHT09450.1 hypothetical protein TRFO_04505 [Tritrichomonas foetus]